MIRKPERLETMFALEFGQLLENHIFGSSVKEEVTEIICSSLGLRSRQQLAQIFAGYDTPSTANIFELIRTLNSPQFTERFLSLQTTLLNQSLEVRNKALEPARVEETATITETPQRPYWEMGEPQVPTQPLMVREDHDPDSDEWGDVDFSMLND